MKRCLAVFFCVVLISAAFAGLAEATDYRAAFEAMSLEELKQVEEICSEVLNEKLVSNASLTLSMSATDIPVNKTSKADLSCDGRTITKDTTVTYTSSAPEIAAVAKGVVTGKAEGSAEITATATFEDGAVLTDTVTVRVYFPVTAVKFAQKTAEVVIGKTLDLSPMVSIAPEKASEKGVTYSVDDESIASVDENGVVTPKAAGTVHVTATSAENTAKPFSASVAVSVLQPVKSIALEETEFNIGRGSSKTLTAAVGPDDASKKTVTWTSENPEIAKVTAKGQVTGVGTGTTVLHCTADDGSGVEATASVTVITAVKAINLAKKEITLFKDQTLILEPTFTPKDPTNTDVTYSSSDTNVAAVTGIGKIIAKNTGKCTITVEAQDGSGAKTSVTVYVEPKNPLYVSSIHWQTTWGTKNGKMGVQATSNCVHLTIKKFDYTIECTTYFGTNSTDSDTYSGTAIKPGKTEKGKLSTYSVSGFSNAYRVQVTPTRVYFSDGTVYDIPSSSQYTSNFEM